MSKVIDAETVRAFVIYDQETGYFWQRTPRAGCRNGVPLGHVESNGYRRIMIHGHRILAHHLAWLYVHGEMPPLNLDHRNRKPDDNRIENLRLATKKQNSANTRAKCPSGLKGAHYNRFRGYWQSYIRSGGQSRFLGRFDSALDAHNAYMKAAIEIHGEFAGGSDGLDG